jgi:hypothetical protein
MGTSATYSFRPLLFQRGLIRPLPELPLSGRQLPSPQTRMKKRSWVHDLSNAERGFPSQICPQSQLLNFPPKSEAEFQAAKQIIEMNSMQTQIRNSCNRKVPRQTRNISLCALFFKEIYLSNPFPQMAECGNLPDDHSGCY